MKQITLTIATIIFFTSGANAQSDNAQYNSGYANNPSQYATTEIGLLNGVSVFTIEFWVKTIESRGNNIYWQRPYLFGNETNGNNSGDFGITTNFGYIGMYEGMSILNNDQQFLSSGVKINDNRWHHIAAVNNGQSLSLYVDGKMIGSLVSGKELITTNAPLTFGAASLNHNFPGNLQGNINFASQASFGEARISNGIRYGANFIPSQSFSSDGNTVALFNFDRQNNNNQINNNQYNNTQANNHNEQGSYDQGRPRYENVAQPATLYLANDAVLNGRLSLGKKNWSLGGDIYIQFYEDNTSGVKYYKPEDIKGYQMGGSYYEPRFLGTGGAINTPLRKTMVRRLTPPGTKMTMYDFEMPTETKNANGVTEYKTTILYFVQLPNTSDDKVYQFSDNKFSPHFESKVSALVQDKTVLADKIRNK
jgi:hypothetical protein